MGRIGSALWSLLIITVVGTLLITVVMEAVLPFLPIIGIAVTILVIVAVARLLFPRRRL